ncbi:hypothetical protein BC938DRAFT_483440 [Jimgerdemannia flammicorona]|uniref:Uncharacterized protein n=1 Tax=Jimgerdemannia flammicorona TaxID=994334 RepID=A0A433QVL5_9FUNG|nr:hypothetical protein BC938DRAFT_483440 [Jimgerdemannia flammicorona]
MFSRVFDIVPLRFRKDARLEPQWYRYLRGSTAILALLSVTIYSCILIRDYQRGDTYMVPSRIDREHDPTYNGSVLIPGLFMVQFNGYGPMQNITSVCALMYPPSNENLTLNAQYKYFCNGVLKSTREDILGIPTFYYETLPSNPLYLSDTSCAYPSSQMPCPGLTMFMAMFYPTNATEESFINFAIVDGGYKPYTSDDNSLTYYASNNMHTAWAVRPGEGLQLRLQYTLYYPIQGDPYYEYTQQTTTIPIATNGSAIAFEADTVYINVNVERYALSLGTVIGLIGGLYSVVASVFANIFGMKVMTPWGILPKYVPFVRRHLKPLLEEQCNTPDVLEKTEVPLPGDIAHIGHHDHGQEIESLRSETNYLRARLRNLERVLEQFYLDKGLLEHLASDRMA